MHGDFLIDPLDFDVRLELGVQRERVGLPLSRRVHSFLNTTPVEMLGPLSVLLQIFLIVLLTAGIAYLLYQVASMFIFPENGNEETTEEETDRRETSGRDATESRDHTSGRGSSSDASSSPTT